MSSKYIPFFYICIKFLLFAVIYIRFDKSREKIKCIRWMPWLSEAMKDVISCDKLRLGANDLLPGDFRMGQPVRLNACHPIFWRPTRGTETS